jgi:hypothetical protein
MMLLPKQFQAVPLEDRIDFVSRLLLVMLLLATLVSIAA